MSNRFVQTVKPPPGVANVETLENSKRKAESSSPVNSGKIREYIKGYRPFLLVVFFFSLYLSYLILRPFLDTLIFSIVLASLLHPVQVFFVHRLYKGRKNLAAITTVLLFTFLIALPVFLLSSALISQGVDSVNTIGNWIREGNLQRLIEDHRIAVYADKLHEKFPSLDIQSFDITGNLLRFSKDAGQFLLSRGASLVGNVAGLVAHFFIMIFVLFYLVRDGDEMVTQMRSYSPLRAEQEDRILGGIGHVAHSVLMGTFLTALAQGIVGGIGLYIVGIPGLFWGTMMAFASLVPLVGTALIWIPVVVYLLLLGSVNSAVFLSIWCILFIGGLDNFLRPFLLGGKGNLSPFYVFLAIIGGVQHFGLAGILYGPLILSFAMIMLFIYGTEYRDDLLGENKADERTDEAEAETAG